MAVKVDGLILAAGLSKRTQEFKMTLDLFGVPLLARAIESMSSVCKKITIVGGYRFQEIRQIVAKFDNCRVVYNRDFQKGMFSSFKVGIQHMNTRRFFMTPGDIPFITPAVYKQMLKVKGNIVVPRFGDRNGHPLLLSSSFIPELIEMPDSSILKDYIKEREITLFPVEDEGILLDIDTLSDYYELLEKYKSIYTVETKKK